MHNHFLAHFLENKIKASMILVVLSIIVVILFLQLHNYSNKLITHNKQLAFAISDIKYLTTHSQLLFEKEINSGNDEIKKIDVDLKQSIEEVEKLLEGGEILGFDFVLEYHDTKTIEMLSHIKEEIEKVVEIIHKVHDSVDKKDGYEELDNEFMILNTSLKELDVHQNIIFKEAYDKYTQMQYAAYVTMGVLALFGFMMLRSLTHDIEDETYLEYIDELTDVQNRNGYEIELDKLLYLSERYKTAFSIIMFDIDGFRDINERFGDRIGDLILIDLVKLIEESIREPSDMIFRVGGEEFIILCPNTALQDGVTVAEKVRREINEKLDTINDMTITISAGVTEVRENDSTPKIDQRLSELMEFSKMNGKNMVSSDIDLYDEEENDSEDDNSHH